MPDIPVVEAVPVEATALVNGIAIAVPVLGVDAVPLIDAATAKALGAVNNFKVRQRTSIIEGVSQGLCETENIYDIFDASTGKKIFAAKERSDTCARCCCAPYHSVFLEFKSAVGKKKADLKRDKLKSLPTVMWAEREGLCSCSKIGLGCCICHQCCANEMFVHAGDVPPGATVGSLAWTDDKLIGYIMQPVPFGGGLTPTLNIMERASPADGSVRPIAKLEGPCCFGGCTELCCTSTWLISSMQPHQYKKKIKTGDMAKIVKQRPRRLKGAAREALTDSDSFVLAFPDGNLLAPQQKAVMMSSLLLVDYMFFEQDNGMCRCEGTKLICTLFECYWCGAVVPCNCEYNFAGGGGSAPTSEEMER